ncbi:glycosyltransferase family 2 protein [Acidaminococcus massiliensis]|jgi:cellulose synthase/poly-beta-1,6-N-acetylglucosamine synthase-like glycosyltransferase|uniref:glycosyltransferase family 2 protein n=1 Tax=Acidaminococcus massiliensis TaxID=1852375 RepID=UPI0022E79654|nr:glycosyltransferase family 2 protein [Acidaminococcus massiliensis]
MSTYFDIIMVPLQVLIVFFTIYYFVISLFGILPRKKEKKILTPKTTFAVIVAAHNEEKVIGELVENLHMLRYPDELYDIFVIADNCSDHTAEVARKAGALVYERFNQEEVGKGFALEWMFRQLFALDKQYDAVAIFDADNLVHPDFLKEMNNRFCKGEKLIQGYLDVKNPNDSWVSGTFAINFWIVNHVWHLAKYTIGLSSVFGGTGMVIATEVLKKYGWKATCLTEDMEFTMKCLLEGIPTAWCQDAIIYDEKPQTFKASWNQRKRWAQGQFDVAGRYMGKLLKEGIRKRDIVILDGVIDVFQPYFMLISTFFVLCSTIYNFVPFYTNVLYALLPYHVWQVIGVAQYVIPAIILFKINAAPKSWFYTLFYPLLLYSWVPITILGFLHRHEHVWSHTIHTRSISFNDVLVPESAETGPKQIVLPKEKR